LYIGANILKICMLCLKKKEMSWTKFALLGGVAYATGIVTGPIVLAAAAGMYFRGSRKKTIVVEVEKVVIVQNDDEPIPEETQPTPDTHPPTEETQPTPEETQMTAEI
jgi:hypothetical protein